MQNVDLAKKLYAAFAKGDIDSLIDHLTTESVFRFDGPSVMPYAGEHRTPQEIRNGFFGPLVKSLSDEMLSPEEFVDQHDKVVMIGRYKATIAATGKTVDQAVVHLSKFH
jgi:ketosteroid isomerase-like protein